MNTEINAVATATTENVTNVTEVKVKSGRPTNPNSKRQIELAEKAALREAGLLKRGRKADPNSKNAIKAAEKAARIASGIEIKPGRPKVVKIETIDQEATNNVVEQA